MNIDILIRFKRKQILSSKKANAQVFECKYGVCKYQKHNFINYKHQLKSFNVKNQSLNQC